MQRVMCLSWDECLYWAGGGGHMGEVRGCRVRGKKVGALAAGEGD